MNSPSIYRLSFPKGVHLGRADGEVGCGDSALTLLADTLFSGLCHAWLHTHGVEALEDLLTRFQSKETPWRLSNGFLWTEDAINDFQLWFPKPAKPFNRQQAESQKPPKETSSAAKKEVKRLNFIPQAHLADWLESRFTAETAKAVNARFKAAIQSESRTQVAITGRDEPMPYSLGATYFKDSHELASGLWIAVSFGSEAEKEPFEAALRFLGETLGIGGKTSLGFGRFEWEPWKDEKAWQALSQHLAAHHASLLLSQANPETTAFAGEDAYQLMERKGWHFSTHGGWAGIGSVKKKPVVMVQAGAVFASPWQGRLVEVTPTLLSGEDAPHPLYRYGHALWLGKEAS